MNSFLLIKEISQPWISLVDGNGYFWIEEYPTEPPTFTLNGFIFAILGVIDFIKNFIKTFEPETNHISYLLLDRSLKTVADNLNDFRNPNNMSSYWRFSNYPTAGYHLVHIKQLHLLSKYMPTEPIFLKLVAELERDQANFDKKKGIPSSFNFVIKKITTTIKSIISKKPSC